MSFTLLQDNRIVVGPRDWNPRYFEHFLQELGFEITLPTYPISEQLVFSDSVRLVPTIQEQTPEINPQFEVLAGPFFKFDEANNHVSYYTAQSLPLETIHANLRAIVANSRWIKEVTPIVRDINGKLLTISTDRESRAIYAQALTFMSDNFSSQWKFEEGFVTINKTDLQTIVAEVIAHVQTCFDWEAQKIAEINSTASVDALKQILLE